MNRDPRYRARLNQISSTLESANLTTQASLWNFKESYLGPCLASTSSCLEGACYPCIGVRRERARARQRRSAAAASRGRPEFVFDFYNDEWDTEDEEADERSGLLRGWGADELDRLLAGSGAAGNTAEDMSGRQPKRKPGMSYGATSAGAGRRRRQSTLLSNQGNDPTILPGSSMFGFLERLPWRIGGRGVRYKPSAADLQENLGIERHKEPGMYREEGSGEETSALLAEQEDEDDEGSDTSFYQKKNKKKSHRRNRSDTTSSRSTQNSLSSRGDLFPSEDEAADAVPLDDSFALSFARRSSDGEHDSPAYTDPEAETESTPAIAGAKSKSKSSDSVSPSSSRHQSSKSIKSTKSSKKGSVIQQRTSEPHTPRSPAHSEMVHSPLTPAPPLTPSASGDKLKTTWAGYSDAENEADESALVSPVVERREGATVLATQDENAEELKLRSGNVEAETRS